MENLSKHPTIIYVVKAVINVVEDQSRQAQSSSTDVFINKAIIIHGSIYDYSLVNYVNARTKVQIICKTHGIFEQRPDDHLHHKGCPICSNGKNEQLVLTLLQKYNIAVDYHKRIRDWNSDYPNYIVDFYIPSAHLIIEYNGEQHYTPTYFGNGNRDLHRDDTRILFQKQQLRDLNLEELCKSNMITLIWIDGRQYKNSKLEKYFIEHILPLLN